jgi:hypothetical protein
MIAFSWRHRSVCGIGEDEMIYILAILVPGLAFWKMKKYGLMMLCVLLQCTILGWLPAAIWATISVIFYEKGSETDRLIAAIEKMGRASEPPRPEPPRSSPRATYSSQTDRRVDEILGERALPNVRETYRTTSIEERGRFRVPRVSWAFNILMALTFVVLGTFYGPSLVEYGKSTWDRIFKPKDDIASLIVCCKAMCRHMECNGYIKISCEQTYLEAELDRTKLTIKDAKNNVVTELGKGASGVQIPECM